MKPLLAAGGIMGFLAVAIGAFGAHGLKEHLSADAMAVYQTGVQYHMAHALAVILAALASDRLSGQGRKDAVRAGWCFVGGTALFAGSLYLLAVTGITGLGAITPIGGIAFLVGWGLLAASVLRKNGS